MTDFIISTGAPEISISAGTDPVILIEINNDLVTIDVPEQGPPGLPGPGGDFVDMASEQLSIGGVKKFTNAVRQDAAALLSIELMRKGEVDAAIAGRAALSHAHTTADVTGLDAALAARPTTTGGKLDASVLPALAITTPTVVASQAAMLALTAEEGDVAIRTDVNKTFILASGSPTLLASWQELLTPTAAVSSVAGKTGAVTLVKGDVGLSSVDNTADSAKPVSTAQAAAILAGGNMTGKVTTLISATGGAGFNLPPGADPTSPVNGDFWALGSTALRFRMGGTTYSAAFLDLANQSWTAKPAFMASTTATASIKVRHGVAPTSPEDGDIWSTTAGLYVRVNGATVGPLGTGGGGGGTAASVSFSPTGGVAATDVQAAIAELDSEKVAKTGGAVEVASAFFGINAVAGTGSYMQVNAPAAYEALQSFGTGTVARWGFGKTNVAETGGNAGSHFSIYRYKDDGSWLSTVLEIKRDTGAVFWESRPFFNYAEAWDSANLPFGTGIINTASATYSTNADLTTVIPIDDTVPTSSEGTQILSASITPKSTSSKIMATFDAGGGIATGPGWIVAALFAGTTCLKSKAIYVAVTSSELPIGFQHIYTPGVTTAVTLTVRVGPGATGTIRLNGTTAGRLLGGTQAATLTLEEIK